MPPGDDDKIYAYLQAAIPALGIDPGRVHFTGFSDGGEMTFRFTCAHAEMFASVAAAAAVGCFQPGQTPSREIPLLFMNGTKDALVDFQTSAIPQRDAIIATWNLGPGTVVASGTGYQRTRYTSPGGDVFEFLQTTTSRTIRSSTAIATRGVRIRGPQRASCSRSAVGRRTNSRGASR